MLEPVNALLREIGTYPGLVILATNQRPEFLDHALQRRLIGEFEFNVPNYLTRVKLWESKWPAKLPVNMNNGEFADLAHFALTGAGIENAIIDWVSDTLRREAEFSLDDLKIMLAANKHLNRQVNVEKELTSE
jgi:AAA+ superfamily predicted ATPase